MRIRKRRVDGIQNTGIWNVQGRITHIYDMGKDTDGWKRIRILRTNGNKIMLNIFVQDASIMKKLYRLRKSKSLVTVDFTSQLKGKQIFKYVTMIHLFGKQSPVVEYAR